MVVHCVMCKPKYFYPRPPRGGRPDSPAHQLTTHTFLSTPSARRATNIENNMLNEIEISIHALREEGDWQRRFISHG